MDSPKITVTVRGEDTEKKGKGGGGAERSRTSQLEDG